MQVAGGHQIQAITGKPYYLGLNPRVAVFNRATGSERGTTPFSLEG
jgi:hypothetical protein